MRTKGLLLMDTPLPDGRIFLGPMSFAASATPPQQNVDGFGLVNIPVTNTTVVITSVVDRIIQRYGMSDDAQQQFGQGNPSGGYQGAQAQAVTTTTPFTTPYDNTGRPPQPSVNYFTPPTSRLKGIMPLALNLGYSVAGGAATNCNATLCKTPFVAGVVPVTTNLLNNVSGSLAVSNFTIAKFPIAPNLQSFLQNFEELSLSISIVTGAGVTLKLYWATIDVAFNHN